MQDVCGRACRFPSIDNLDAPAACWATKPILELIRGRSSVHWQVAYTVIRYCQSREGTPEQHVEISSGRSYGFLQHVESSPGVVG